MNWFAAFKYIVYAALIVNIGLFMQEEWAAASHVFGDSVPLADIISAFAATIDTLAWVVLLLVFELETYQIPDHRLTPAVTRTLLVVRVFCYTLIVYALYGYVTKALGLSVYLPAAGLDVCAAQGLSLLVDLDEYVPVSAANCAMNSDIMYHAAAGIVAPAATFEAAWRLAWIDVINATTWILVVLNLELDVQLLLRDWFRGWVEAASKRSKFLLYAVLVLVAAYWGLFGDFLDFWDAFLWIVAFVFIERNVVIWEQEIEEEHEQAGHTA